MFPESGGDSAGGEPSRSANPRPKGGNRKPKHTAERYKEAATLHKLLSEPTRLAILGLLSEGERNVGEICGELGMQQPAVSHHLALFRVSGLIEQQRSGKSVYYMLTDRGRSVFTTTEVLIGS